VNASKDITSVLEMFQRRMRPEYDEKDESFKFIWSFLINFNNIQYMIIYPSYEPIALKGGELAERGRDNIENN
jgi:hypothetical protein